VTELSAHFLHFLKQKTATVHMLGQDQFLPNPFQFITDNGPKTHMTLAVQQNYPTWNLIEDTAGITFSMLLLKTQPALRSACSS
jgi:hypothetical protein